MNLLWHKLIFAVLLLLVKAYGTVGVNNPNATLYPQDVEAVNALLKLLSGPNLDTEDTRFTFTSNDCGDKLMYKIKCNCSFDNYTCRVTEIDFTYGGLVGEIPAQIGNLTYLKSLDLASNMLNGSIPKSFENLSQLSELILYDNDLEGPIPDFLGNLKMLQIISLSSNWFSGSIPKKLGALPSLRVLRLDGNLLMEGIPPELGNIASLRILELSNNGLSGQLPPQLGNLSSIEIVNFANNEFSGELPPRFKDLVNLTYFNIRGNNFSGTIPKYIVNWKKLVALWLIGNNFEGPLPTEISTLENLQELHVSDLSEGPGGGNGFSFPNISKLTSLEILTLRNCSLVGPIPDSIGRISTLNHLDLSFNNLTGGIPTFIRYPYNIFLRRNELNGSLPPWMTNLTISYVDVSENFFTNLTIRPGNISPHLNLFECCSNKTNMTQKWQKNRYTCDADEPSLYDQLHINCGGEATSINGSNYEADLQDDGASVFNMSDGKRWDYSSMGIFQGNRWAYSSMGIFQGNIHTGVHGNFIENQTCNITMADAPLYTSSRFSAISLKYFGFCLKNDWYTVKLHFAEIVLEEKDAMSIKGRRVFDVEIQGQKVLENFNIAEEAGDVNKDITKEFNTSVNDNRLEIHLYWAGKGSTIGKAGSYGPLISAISVSPVPKKHQRLSALSIAGIVAAALFFSALILFIFWKKGWLGGKDQPGEEQKQMELLLPGRFFNYRQIRAATQDFSTVNKLGEGGFGSVYKGVLPDGNIVAVKQLSAKSGQGIREFVNEIAIISTLQHPNLVRLMGCCAEDNQLLLIYEYMENKSLDHLLFGPKELKSRLNWATRVKICLGIAKGLAFLHEESKQKIIHRDIKPTNILLDKDLNAKISDFGFAKLTEEEKTHVITRVAGTTGYMAPEYAMRGHLTNKADVYSFGVVTLEIVSGKNSANYRPNDQSVYLLDLAYVLQEQGNLISLVDPALGSSYTWKEAAKILDLAMWCTSFSYSLRPTMSDVVKILEGKTEIKTTETSAPYSMDDFAMAKAMVGLSQSTQSVSSTSRDGASDTTFSQSISKEIEEPNISADHSVQMVTEQSEKSKKETP